MADLEAREVRERSRSVIGVGKELAINSRRGVGLVELLAISFLPKITTLGVLKELALPSRGAMITGLTSMTDGAEYHWCQARDKGFYTDAKRSRSPAKFEPALSRCRFLVCLL